MFIRIVDSYEIHAHNFYVKLAMMATIVVNVKKLNVCKHCPIIDTTILYDYVNVH